MKAKLANRGARKSAIAAVITLVALVAFLIYGIMYPVYADYTVMIFYALGIACFAGHVFWDHPIAEVLPPCGVALTALAMNLMFLNSYTVWADWYGNFDMYGSQGGITPVIILMVLSLIAIIAGIVSCFSRKTKEA